MKNISFDIHVSTSMRPFYNYYDHGTLVEQSWFTMSRGGKALFLIALSGMAENRAVWLKTE